MGLISDFSKLLSTRFKTLSLRKVKKVVPFIGALASKKFFVLLIRRETRSGWVSRRTNRMEHLEIQKYAGSWSRDAGVRWRLMFVLPHSSFVVASQGNFQHACSATKAGNSFSESYLEIQNPFIVVLYYIIFYFITCVGCRGPHSCVRAFILSFSTVYFIKTSFLFL